MDGPQWYDVSAQAKRLINRMLDKEPKTRFSANECLNDSWFKRFLVKGPESDMNNLKLCLENMN